MSECSLNLFASIIDRLGRLSRGIRGDQVDEFFKTVRHSHDLFLQTLVCHHRGCFHQDTILGVYENDRIPNLNLPSLSLVFL